jgi:hypothetical protein
LVISSASEFETHNIQILHQIKAKEDEANGKKSRPFALLSMVEEHGSNNYVEIKTEAELDEFIAKLRNRVIAELNQNKIVGLK